MTNTELILLVVGISIVVGVLTIIIGNIIEKRRDRQNLTNALKRISYIQDTFIQQAR